MLANLALSYEGALDYEKLKKYPFREIELLTDTMNEINKRKEDAINRVKGGSGMGSTIGNFS
jgi:hypothetical protein